MFLQFSMLGTSSPGLLQRTVPAPAVVQYNGGQETVDWLHERLDCSSVYSGPTFPALPPVPGPGPGKARKSNKMIQLIH